MNAAAKSQEAFAAKEVAALKARLEGFEQRLAFKGSGVIGGIEGHLFLPPPPPYILLHTS